MLFGKNIQQKRQDALERNEHSRWKQEERTERYMYDFYKYTLPVLLERGMRRAKSSYARGGPAIGEVRLPVFVLEQLLSSAEMRTRMSRTLYVLTSGTGFTARVQNGSHLLNYMAVTWIDMP